MPKIRILGHALHPMLVVFPLGLLATSLAWDIAYLASGNGMWGDVAFWTIVAGCVGALAAALTGTVDWLGIPKHTRAFRLGLYHMLLNVGVLVLFVVSAILRYGNGYSTPSVGQMLFGWIGIGIALVSGWLGGELVERLGIGVYPDANPDAPSSLATDLETYDRGGRRPTPPIPVGPHEPSPI